MENCDIHGQDLDVNGNDDQVRSLQQRVKQLELQNQLLQQQTQVETQQSKFNLNDVQLIDLRDTIIDQDNEDSWLYESPKAQPTPEQKLQSPWKWMEKGCYDELQQIRGNLASKFNQVNSDVTDHLNQSNHANHADRRYSDISHISHISRSSGRKGFTTPPSIKIHGNNNRQEFQRSVENIDDDLPRSNALYKSISNTNIHYDDSKLKQHADTSKLSNPSINIRRHSLTTNNRLTPNNRGIDRSITGSGLSPRGSVENLNDNSSRFGLRKSNQTAKATLTVGTPVEHSRQFSRSTNDVSGDANSNNSGMIRFGTFRRSSDVPPHSMNASYTNLHKADSTSLLAPSPITKSSIARSSPSIPRGKTGITPPRRQGIPRTTQQTPKAQEQDDFEYY